MARSHPYTKHRVMAFAARTRWVTLVVFFFAAIVVSAAIFALIERPSSVGRFLEDWAFFGGFLIGADPLVVRGDPLTTWWLPLLAGLIKTLLHACLLGAVLFKLLVPQELFAVRQRLIVRPTPAGGWELLVRLYNSTNTEVVLVTFDAFLRTPTLQDSRRDAAVDGSDGRPTAPFVANRKLDVDPMKKDWPISIQHVPYSLPIPLDAVDVCFDGASPRLRTIQGCSITPMGLGDERGHAYLALLIRGQIPSLGSELVETHWFQMSGPDAQIQYEFGNFHDVDVTPGIVPRRAGGKSETWPGWERFDATRALPPRKQTQHAVFGYGSLVDIERLREFLGSGGLALGGYAHRTLSGFRRAWTVAMDNRKDLPNYKFYVDPATGQRLDVYVSFLNIVRVRESDLAKGAAPPEVDGVLFEVEESALAMLDQRERNYCRCDISSFFPDLQGLRIWTYIGSPEAEERFRIGLIEGNVVIDANYLHAVETAFRAAGLRYTAEQDPRIHVLPLHRINT